MWMHTLLRQRRINSPRSVHSDASQNSDGMKLRMRQLPFYGRLPHFFAQAEPRKGWPRDGNVPLNRFKNISSASSVGPLDVQGNWVHHRHQTRCCALSLTVLGSNAATDVMISRARCVEFLPPGCGTSDGGQDTIKRMRSYRSRCRRQKCTPVFSQSYSRDRVAIGSLADSMRAVSGILGWRAADPRPSAL